MDGPTAAIEVKGLSKTYRVGFWLQRRVHALQGLDLSVQEGQIYGLLGPNGAGKSTTIKILMNLVKPNGGTALVLGRAPGSVESRRGVGFVPENPAPYEYLTGREFVKLAGRLVGLSGHELDQRATEVLGSVELGAAEKLQIRRYSKGMVQRVALAQALMGRPKLLVLDEPTSGLDPLGRRLMRDLILAEKEKKTTILFCTHIIPDIEALCDRVAVVIGGKRVQDGSVQELLSTMTPTMEVMVEGMAPEAVRSLGFELESVQALEQRVLVKVKDADSQKFLSTVLTKGGRVSRLQSARSTLEDLFMEAMKSAGNRRVGAEIS